LPESKNPTNQSKGKVIIRKKKIYTYKEVYRNAYFMGLIKESMERKKREGYYRSNMFGEEIIRQGVKYKCLSKMGRKYLPYLYIFNLVKRDAMRYVQNNPAIKNPRWLSSIHWNSHQLLPKGEIVGTDINNAYWDIAFNLGVISYATHAHKNRIKHKNLLLASLSSLGADKMWRNVKGTVGSDVTIIKGDDRLKQVFQKIRYTCFSYMRQIARMLGNDFICYKTDCIYYIKTEKNIQLVEEFIESKKLDFKRLINPKRMQEDQF
jgi:hypothetical protein